jgi:hypothetical protein
MTVATDAFLALVCVVLGGRLIRARPGPFLRLVGTGFFVLAAAALLGASVHGFGPQLSLPAKAVLWRLIYLGIGLTNLLLLAGMVLPLIGPTLRRVVWLALGLRFAVVLVMAWGRDFGFALVDVAVTLLLLLGIGLFFTLARRRPFGPWLLAGALASLLGAVVQAFRIGFHPSFNHNDLFHVIQVAGMLFFYRAALRLPVAATKALTLERTKD